jgi:hypothetical protein
MAASEASALKPIRTDSVCRGLSISLFTLERISLSFSVKFFFRTVSPF